MNRWLKPQFEAGRREVSRGRGIITDPAVHSRACDDVVASLSASGAAVIGIVESSVHGAKGNTEFLVHAQRVVPT